MLLLPLTIKVIINMKTIKYFTILIVCMCLYKSSAALIRGYSTGEIYFGSTWYWVAIGDRYNAIFYSNDHGQSLEIVYVCDIDAGDMQPYPLMRDATPGVFYNIQPTDFWISSDYCSTWQICPNIIAPFSYYATGAENGVIYTRPSDEPKLFKSYDYANSFEQIKEDSIFGILEIGTESDELYYYTLPSIYTDFEIHFSNNGGMNFFLVNRHDSIICGIVMGYNPRIYHGANPGELYLVSWFPPAIFKIFHSTDYGYRFEHRFTSSFCDLFYEGYGFTPGVESGEFYYYKNLSWFDGINTKIHIYHSSDTAKTFTEYVHVLDSNFPVGIYNEDVIEQKLLSFYNYPNPFTNTTTLRLDNIESGNYVIEITSLSGQTVLRKEEYFDMGGRQIPLNTSSLSPGVYLCAIKHHGHVIGVQKMVKR
jgi:hypothetical protein